MKYKSSCIIFCQNVIKIIVFGPNEMKTPVGLLHYLHTLYFDVSMILQKHSKETDANDGTTGRWEKSCGACIP